MIVRLIFLFTFLIAFLFIAAPIASYAQNVSITNGLNWLSVNQNADGAWGTSSSTTVIDTTEVIKAKINFGNDSSIQNAATWLTTQEVDTVDELSREVSSLAYTGTDTSSLISALINAKNSEGEWGYKTGYSSTPLDTALALQALKSTNYADLSTINAALAYLTSTQNPDGSWSFSAGTPSRGSTSSLQAVSGQAASNVYLTAIVSATLQQFPQTAVIATAVSKATSCLLAAQNPSGSFGPEASAYETALAFIALVGNGQTQDLPLQNAVNFLTSNQAANGSWNDDPYSTALALKALYLFENRPAPPPPPPAAGKFTGTVLDAATRQGVSGVSVVLEGSPLTSTVTDSAGNFTLADATPGAQKLVFSLTGYASTAVSATSIADVTSSLGTVTMTSASSTGTISGTILDPTGKPLADVAIAVSGVWSGSATTGPDGTFSFSFVTPGDVTITASKTGYQSFTGSGRVYPRTNLAISPRLNAAPSQIATGSIVGRVVSDMWGLPIDHLTDESGVRVTISGGAFVEPDPDNGGRFAISGLAPNTYQVTVGMSGFASQTFRLIIAPGVTTDLGTIRLVMSASTITLTGKVADRVTGLPIPDAEVMVVGSSLTGRADFAGVYTIADIRQQEFTVKVSADGYVGKSSYLYQGGGQGAAWTQQVDFTLDPLVTKGSLGGTVVDAVTGQPLAGASLALLADPNIIAITDNSGIFNVAAVPKGLQQFIIALSGYAPRILTMSIVPGRLNDVGSIPIALTSLPATVRGGVTDGSVNAPFAGVPVQIGSSDLQSVSGADGDYIIDNVAPGKISVTASKSGYFPARFTAHLEPGGILVFNPSMFTALPANVEAKVATDKTVYSKGEPVRISVKLVNRQSVDLPGTVHLLVTAPSGATVYDATLDAGLVADGSLTFEAGFTLPAAAEEGMHTVTAVMYDAGGTWLGTSATTFGLSVSRITITPGLPAAFTTGANAVSFNLVNTGALPVSSGVVTVTLKDPDGQLVANEAFGFSLAVGESRTLAAVVTVPPLKFGVYTLAYSQHDETRTGLTTEIPLPNAITISAAFDSNSHRTRNTAGLTVGLTNSGRFNYDAGLAVTVNVPDAAFSETKTISAIPAAGTTLVYGFTIPSTITSGEHNAIVTAALPGGSAVTKGAKLVIFESALALVPLQATWAAGETITPVIANSGGVDAPVQYRLSLYDANGALIAEKSGSETVIAGASLPLALAIPNGAVSGDYSLLVGYKNLATGSEETATRPLAISGVKGTLAVQTGKQDYLATESISALSSIANSGSALQGGNLHLQVTTAAGSQKQKTWTSKFDFQQGGRNGVDTFGVNDWLIPDDDFEGAAINGDKWITTGNVKVKNGQAYIYTADISSKLASTWQLDGDFDIQVDYESNNSVADKGAEFAIQTPTYWFFIKNTNNEGNISAGWINGIYTGWVTGGSYSTSGKFRITRTGNTVATYYWNGSGWSELLRRSSSYLLTPSQVNIWVWDTTGANVAFDNFKVNSGRIVTKNETADSVRLLPLNDNFDDGLINSERWYVQNVATNGPPVTLHNGTASEVDGTLAFKLTNANFGDQVEALSTYRLAGDFDVQVDWSELTTDIGNGSGIELGVGTGWSNYAFIKSSLTGNNIHSRDAIVNGAWGNAASVNTADTKGRLRITRNNSIVRTYYFSNNQWTELGTSFSFVPDPVGLVLKAWSGATGNVGGKLNNFNVVANKHTASGTIRLRADASSTTRWGTLAWHTAEPAGSSIKFRTRTAATDAGLSSAPWSGYLTASGSAITSPPGRWIEVEATLSTTDTNITPLLHDVTVTYGNNPGDIVWQADAPVNLAQGALSDLNSVIGVIATPGKYFLQGVITSSTGQPVASAEYPFFVTQGNTLISFTTDKRIYKPGETVRISGEVRNLGTVEAANLTFNLKGKPASGAEQGLYSAIFTLPAGGSRPFSTTTTAGSEGSVTLTGTVIQNSATLAEVADRYEVAIPKVTAALTAPDAVGIDPFTLTLTLDNSGKTDAVITVAKSFTSPAETVTIPAGQTKLLQYGQQISADTTFAFTLSGDLTRQLTRTVAYIAAIQAVKVSAKTVTDKISYNANEQVAITTTITCPSGGTSGDNLAVRMMILNSDGEALFMEQVTLSLQGTGRVYTNNWYWNTAGYPSGPYTARMVIEGGGAALATAEAAFTILPSSTTAAGVAGTVSPAMNPVYLGMDQFLAITLANSGNENLTGATLSVSVINPDTQAIVQTYSKEVFIPRQGTLSDTVIVSTASLEERAYLAVLQITLPGMAQVKTLAGVPFSVEIAAMPVVFLSTLSNGSVTNNQTLNVTGFATGVVAMKSVTINGSDVPLNSDGSFSHALLLQPGSNAVIVTVTDVLQHAAGETREIILDQAAPALVINEPSDNSKTATSPIEIKGSVDETSTVTVKVNDSVQSAVMNGTDFAATVVPEPGWNTIEITATDIAGNPGSQKRSVLFDDRVPSLSITEPSQDIRTNKGSLTIGGTATDPYTAVGVTVAMDGSIMTPPVVDGSFYQIVTFGEEKHYPITVTATNEVGTQISAQRNVIFDKTPPTLTIDPVVTPTNVPDQAVTGTREEGTDVVVTCDSATAGAMEYPTATTWRVYLTGLQQGENRLQATASDLASNRTTVSATILYAPRAPEVIISATPNQLWPPNKKLVPVTIAGNVVTYGSDIREASVSVADEYGTYTQQGLKFGDTVRLEAWRDGTDRDGRVYTVTAVVTDQAGNVTTKSATVVVPHDRGN